MKEQDTRTVRKMQAYRVEKDSKEMSLQTVPVPSLGAQDVLIKVKSVGLAPGVFTMMRMGMLKSLPYTLGHEIAGVIEEIGSDVRDLGHGDRIRIHSNVSCGKCRYCASGDDQMCVEAGIMGFKYFGKPGRTGRWDKYRDGGLAEYVRAPSWLVQHLPENVNFDVGAKVHELATAYRTLCQARLKPGATLIVIAAPGAVGASVVKLVPLFGVKRLVLVGRSTQRLQKVQSLSQVKCDLVGFDEIEPGFDQGGFGLSNTLQQMIPEGADAIVDLLGSTGNGYPVCRAMAVRGTYVHLGGNMTPLPMPALQLMVNCWTFVGTRNHSRGDSEMILGFLREGHIKADELVTDRWNFDEAPQAVQNLVDRSSGGWFSVINIHDT